MLTESLALSGLSAFVENSVIKAKYKREDTMSASIVQIGLPSFIGTVFLHSQLDRRKMMRARRITPPKHGDLRSGE